MKNLYRVEYINQATGEEVETHVLAKNLAVLEEHFADIISIEPITVEEIKDEE